ncbi:uncharacterized protein LOC126737123 isoform X2 [Anthonomus grandis grandis]|uniref:uncharacterized protein LOC126737123 isoform X2 n=1 Tax=Anthonomus grandis grandis TaxID=2921223 RepID=UPI0021662D3E|nr:uncharacterized protein LOC126737123 isoform X2 [Anthonomus grandis grandis]
MLRWKQYPTAQHSEHCECPRCVHIPQKPYEEHYCQPQPVQYDCQPLGICNMPEYAVQCPQLGICYCKPEPMFEPYRPSVYHQYSQQPCNTCGRVHFQQNTNVSGILPLEYEYNMSSCYSMANSTHSGCGGPSTVCQVQRRMTTASMMPRRSTVVGRRNGLEDDDNFPKNIALQTCKDTGVGDCPACLGTTTNCHDKECQLCCEVKVCGPSFKNCPFQEGMGIQTDPICQFLERPCRCVDPCGYGVCTIDENCEDIGLTCRCIDKDCNTSKHCIVIDDIGPCVFTEEECRCTTKNCDVTQKCTLMEEDEFRDVQQYTTCSSPCLNTQKARCGQSYASTGQPPYPCEAKPEFYHEQSSSYPAISQELHPMNTSAPVQELNQPQLTYYYPPIYAESQGTNTSPPIQKYSQTQQNYYHPPTSQESQPMNNNYTAVREHSYVNNALCQTSPGPPGDSPMSVSSTTLNTCNDTDPEDVLSFTKLQKNMDTNFNASSSKITNISVGQPTVGTISLGRPGVVQGNLKCSAEKSSSIKDCNCLNENYGGVADLVEIHIPLTSNMESNNNPKNPIDFTPKMNPGLSHVPPNTNQQTNLEPEKCYNAASAGTRPINQGTNFGTYSACSGTNQITNPGICVCPQSEQVPLDRGFNIQASMFRPQMVLPHQRPQSEAVEQNMYPSPISEQPTYQANNRRSRLANRKVSIVSPCNSNSADSKAYINGRQSMVNREAKSSMVPSSCRPNILRPAMLNKKIYCIDGTDEYDRIQEQDQTCDTDTCSFAREPFMPQPIPKYPSTDQPQDRIVNTDPQSISTTDPNYEVIIKEIPMPNGQTRSKISIRAVSHSNLSPSTRVQQKNNAECSLQHKAMQSLPMKRRQQSTQSLSQEVRPGVTRRNFPIMAKSKSNVHFDIDVFDEENNDKTIVLRRSVQSQSKTNTVRQSPSNKSTKSRKR